MLEYEREMEVVGVIEVRETRRESGVEVVREVESSL